eukprot:55418-Eustigmatos_ZCMA.PRE.1
MALLQLSLLLVRPGVLVGTTLAPVSLRTCSSPGRMPVSLCVEPARAVVKQQAVEIAIKGDGRSRETYRSTGN